MIARVAAVCLLWCGVVVAAPAPSVVTERFLERRDPPLVSYRAVRHLRASNERRHLSAWLDAVTELDPEGGFRYHVVAEGGSEFIRRHVLWKALVREQAAHDRGEQPQISLTSDNYTFGPALASDAGLVVVPIEPRRRAELLVSGHIALTEDGDLVRIEGRLVKNPSFWTRRVDVVRRYGRANGVRVAIELSSSAQIRIFGLSRFTMCIDYEMVNGVSIEPRTSCS